MAQKWVSVSYDIFKIIGDDKEGEGGGGGGGEEEEEEEEEEEGEDGGEGERKKEREREIKSLLADVRESPEFLYLTSNLARICVSLKGMIWISKSLWDFSNF